MTDTSTTTGISVTRVIILAAGDGTRWGDFKGVPKHLVEVEGERLLDRTCSLFLRYTDDVVVVAPKGDDRYIVPGTRLYSPKVSKTKRELDKFASSMDQWDPNKRNVLVYGDVYFTEEAVETIMTNSDPWKYFCRSKSSEVTGKNCEEIFAIGFMPDRQKWLGDSIVSIIDSPSMTGGWSLFRELTLGGHVLGLDVYDYKMFETGNHIDIDDWTEDFDYPEDLETWERKRSERNG